MTNEKRFRGSCLCGDVTFSIKNIHPLCAHCHCIDCRKFHGAAFSTFVGVDLSDLTWLTGQSNLKTYVADNGSKRQFCEQCGSSLTFQAKAHTHQIEVSLALLDEDTQITPDAHIFVRSKVPWITLNDSLPNHQNHRPNQDSN